MSDQLEKRAVGALTAEPPPSPAALLTLIAEVETGIAAAKAAAETAAKKLLDPIESPDINAARAKVEATEFTGTRLRSLLVRLEDRYELEARAEAAVAWRSKYEALERERDALAKELREVYPTAATRIAVALGRAADLDRRLSQLHQSRPGGAKGTLLGAELVARDLTEFSRDQPPRLRLCEN
jgi:hypothetical protein